MNKKYTYIVIAFVVVAGISFYGGTLYGQSSTGTQRFGSGNGMMQGKNGNTSLNQQGMGQQGMGQRNGGMAIGKILSMDSASMTVELENGGSKIILYSDQTKISKTQEASISDLKAGEQVVVQGGANEDGSITANMVQIGSRMRIFQNQ